MVAAGIKGRLKKIKMNRRHLGTQDRIIRAHFFRELDLVDGRGTDGALLVVLFPDPDGGEKGTDPNPGGA